MLASFLLAAIDSELPPPQGNSLIQTLILFAIGALFLYFVMIRPESNRRKEQESMRTALKKGDRVTALGIIGTVAQIKDQTVILRMVDGAKIEVLKGAISEIMPGSGDEKGDESST